jgi:hypothetical protein
MLLQFFVCLIVCFVCLREKTVLNPFISSLFSGNICDEVPALDGPGMIKLRKMYETAESGAPITSIYLDDPDSGFPKYHRRIAREVC